MSALLMRMRPPALYASGIGPTHRALGSGPEQSIALAAEGERLATRTEIDRLRATHSALPAAERLS